MNDRDWGTVAPPVPCLFSPQLPWGVIRDEEVPVIIVIRVQLRRARGTDEPQQ